MTVTKEPPYSEKEQHNIYSLTERLAEELGAYEPRILHPMSGLFILIDNLFTLIVSFSLIAFQVFNENKGVKEISGIFSQFPLIAFLLPIIILSLIALPIINFWFYRFQVIDGEFRISWGLFNKQQRHIPIIKIHNVAIKQTLLQRFLGVAEVTLESAGSGQESEAHLKVLSIDEALLVESLINAKNLQTQVVQHIPNEQHVSHINQKNRVEPGIYSSSDTHLFQATQSKQLLGLSNGDIIRYGLISNSGIALGGFLTLIFSPERIVQWLWITFVPDDVLENLPEDIDVSNINDILSITNIVIGQQSLMIQIATWFGISVSLLLSVLVVSKVYSVVSAFIRLYDFKLSENGRNLSVEKGLLTRHKSNVPLDKIQVWRIEESWLHRLFNRQTLKLDTAVLGGLSNSKSEQQDERGISELIPMAEPNNIECLLEYWKQPYPEEYEFMAVHPQAFRRIVFIRVVVITLLTLLASVLLSKYLMLWLVSGILLLIFAIFASLKRAEYMGLVVTETHIMWRDGWLNRVCYITEIPHAHAIAITHSPFDRRYDMATLTIDTVGGTLFQAGIIMKYLPYDIAEQVADIVRIRCN